MFYDIFEQLCAEKGVKPGRAADEIGISRATVTNWKKNGYSPRKNILEKIADYFQVSADYLIGESEQKEIPADKNSEDEDDDFVVLARHMKKIPEKERQRIIKNFRETVDMYLEVMGITDDKDKEGK